MKKKKNDNDIVCIIIAAILVFEIAKHFLIYGSEIIKEFRQMHTIEQQSNDTIYRVENGIE